MKDVPVKLDADLKKQIESYISDGEHRFDFPSLKNFVDRAVLGLLKDLKKGGKR
ncbi:MAG: hypothetical protein O2779_02580 [Nanoarchaeota archaeon]|nr:hypothetical protein [Nanoarchaeota archaeon]